MARYIDADALYEKIFPLDVVDKRRYSINAKAVAEAIVGMPTADVAPRAEWISVEERLPDLYGTYLIYTCNNHVKLGRFCEWAIGFAPSFDDYTVTHWMPLPEPPKGD